MKLNSIKSSSVLLELTMNQRTFTQVASKLGDSVLVGFEFEMSIPPGSKMYDREHGNPDADTVDVDDINTQEQLELYFDLGREDKKKIWRDYEEWLDQKAEEWADINWRDFIDPIDDQQDEDDVEHTAKRDATRKWLEDHMSDYSVDDYIADVSGKHIIEDLNLSPIYGWQDEDSGIAYAVDGGEVGDDEAVFNGTADNIASSLAAHVNAVGSKNNVYYSHDGFDSKSLSHWYIEGDASIMGEHGAVQIEVVSPPMPLHQAISTLKQVCWWMSMVGAVTNKSTGLHVGISLPKMEPGSLDYVKLALLMGEKHVLEQFGRTQNKYTQAQLAAVVQYLDRDYEADLTRPTDKLINTLNQWAISNQKYFSFNISKLKHGYLEFRAMGGQYNKTPEKIIHTIYRFVTALDAASDPQAHRKEYIKKLAKLLSIDATPTNVATQQPLESMPQQLQRFARRQPLINDYFKSLATSSSVGQRVHDYAHIVIVINDLLTKFRIQLSDDERRTLIGMMKQYNINQPRDKQFIAGTISREYQDDNQYAYIITALGLKSLLPPKTPQ